VNLFSSHPPIELRVERLRSLNLGGEYAKQFTWVWAQDAGSAGLNASSGAMGLAASAAPPEPSQTQPAPRSGDKKESKDHWVDEYFRKGN
ncbi:hypothetical protein KAX21_05410, partial [candidate division WOR-3 bacterium]|nr:hypothetical protein [candidate division WOR-3 bacterium]